MGKSHNARSAPVYLCLHNASAWAADRLFFIKLWSTCLLHRPSHSLADTCNIGSPTFGKAITSCNIQSAFSFHGSQCWLSHHVLPPYTHEGATNSRSVNPSACKCYSTCLVWHHVLSLATTSLPALTLSITVDIAAGCHRHINLQCH